MGKTIGEISLIGFSDPTRQREVERMLYKSRASELATPAEPGQLEPLPTVVHDSQEYQHAA
ncbi:hypothetical protein KW801_02710 [Candidatus Saccharibacteria bacterium]|nr:hypothetical protein [Candidatus Saccharibacteria bacterium]